jgi:hypothetical protein
MTTWWLLAITENGEPDPESTGNGIFALFRSLNGDTGDDQLPILAARKPGPTVDDSAIAIPEPNGDDG